MTDRAEIERLRYLNDPRKAAIYLGIAQVIVEDVWAAMREPSQRANDITSGNMSKGDLRHVTDREAAKLASHQLRKATLSAMLRWADNNGTTIDDAAGFLLSGRELA